MAIWQHHKRVLGIFSPRMRRNGYLGTSGQKSDRRPRFPIRQMHFHYRVTFTGYIRCFVLLRRMTSWPLPLTFWPWECLMYSTCHVRPIPIFIILRPSVTELRVLNIWSHFRYLRSSHCACAVSRDLCIGGPPKPHVTNFWPRIAYSLYNFYGSTMTISLSLLYFAVPHFQRPRANRYRLWLAKTFHGRSVLFWLKQNSFKTVSKLFVSVLFRSADTIMYVQGTGVSCFDGQQDVAECCRRLRRDSHLQLLCMNERRGGIGGRCVAPLTEDGRAGELSWRTALMRAVCERSAPVKACTSQPTTAQRLCLALLPTRHPRIGIVLSSLLPVRCSLFRTTQLD